MLIQTLLSMALSVAAAQDMPQEPVAGTVTDATVQDGRAAPAISRSSPVRAITSRSEPTGPTRTVCGWERPTGSTFNRRVCREVAVHSGQRDRESEAMLRNMQGSRFGELPSIKKPGER